MKPTTFSIPGRTMHRIVVAVTRICEKEGSLPPDHHVVVKAFVRSNHYKKHRKVNGDGKDKYNGHGHNGRGSKKDHGEQFPVNFLDCLDGR